MLFFAIIRKSFPDLLKLWLEMVHLCARAMYIHLHNESLMLIAVVLKIEPRDEDLRQTLWRNCEDVQLMRAAYSSQCHN